MSNEMTGVYEGPSRLTGTLAEGMPYDYAVIEQPCGTQLGGRCTARHDDGTATVALGDMLPVTARLVRFVPARKSAAP